MARFTPAKKDLDAIVDMLESGTLPDNDAPTARDVAEAIVQRAWDAYEARGKFMVVGQVFDQLGKRIADGKKVAMRPFTTEKQAKDAAMALVGSTSSQFMLRTWVIPMFYGTPNDWHKDLKSHEVGAEEVVQRAADGVADIIATENARLAALKWCREVELEEETMALLECRLDKGHEGPHGNLSPDIGGRYASL